MITVSKMIEKVRTKTQEINKKFLTDESIIDYLDDGLSDVLSTVNIRYETMLHKETEPMDITASQSIYNIPLDCASGRIQLIKIYDGYEWIKLREMDVNDETSLLNLNQSLPQFYIIKGDTFTLYPQPDTTIVDGMIVTYTERLRRIDKQLGTVTGVIDGTKIYVDVLDTTYSDGSAKLNINDYISVTGYERAENIYNFRVKSIDTVNNYIEIFSSTTSLTVTGVSTTSRYFEFSGADLTNIIAGDTLTISGSNANDGIYTIIGIDSTNYRVYVREPLINIIVSGTGVITIPTIYKEKKLYTDAFSLNKGDMITLFEKSASVKLPDIAQDYIVAFAIKASFEEAQEPNQEALVNIQRLAQAIETLPADRVAEIKYQFRGTF